MHALSGTIEGNDDGQTHRHFSGSHGDHEKHHHLAVVVRQAIDGVEAGEGDEAQVGGAQHQLQTHEDDDDVAAQYYASQPDGKQQAGDEEVIVEGAHVLIGFFLGEDNHTYRGD